MVLCVQQVCLGDGPTLKWKVRDWRPATEGRYRSYTVCYLRSNEGLSCDEAKSGSHRDRQIARSVARRPSTKGIDGTTNGASTLMILSHGRPPTITLPYFPGRMGNSSDFNCMQARVQQNIRTAKISKMEPDLSMSTGFPTPASSSHEEIFDNEVTPNDDMMDFMIGDEFDHFLGDLELHNAGYNHSVQNQGQPPFEQLQNQQVLHQPVDPTEFQQLMEQREFNQLAPDQGQASHQSAAVGYAHAGKTIGEMMAEEDNNTYQGYIISHEQAERLEADYIQLASTQVAATIPAASLADLPGPDEERQWRKAIFEAIRDFRNVVNKPRRKDTKDKNSNIIKTEWIENTHVRRVREMKGAATELMGDKILTLAINAHKGIGGIPPWVDKKAWKLESFPSFHERMISILEGLRTNKSIAHSFIQVDPTKRFVAGPKAEVRENIDGNEKRGNLISEGREARRNEGE
ncbi:hypothetical protein NCU07603 [Neurospora crassa OR74A]|uniref:Uncharacterized protein n=1 Tax=Neurospora crassa (strain ATCC 24698 / 74-OR23-1A / CBS 708.71 / DSM 1257 / FGSC 987) TaxID=367110 RepID=Q7SBF3_NEUCR|nr:hypothetical protein NCU07603 [Neurospora crassa OR74A]EAA33747.1 hypothetical protein NCU07603 [Neurospora crassa OR74A]|eukprot:XP_962983.1 hypothetical protein NCU07603 [Neurospora crassa OR74A]